MEWWEKVKWPTPIDWSTPPEIIGKIKEIVVVPDGIEPETAFSYFLAGKIQQAVEEMERAIPNRDWLLAVIYWWERKGDTPVSLPILDLLTEFPPTDPHA